MFAPQRYLKGFVQERRLPSDLAVTPSPGVIGLWHGLGVGEPTSWVGGCAHERRRAAIEFVQRQPKASRVWVIAANRAAGQSLLRHAVASASFGWQATTPDHLAGRVAAPVLASRGLTAVSGAGLDAVAARAIRDLHERGQLGRFSPLAELPGFPRALQTTASELRAHAATPAEVEQLSTRLASLDAALAKLVSAYEARLSTERVVDRAGLLRIAIENASDSEWLDAAVLWLDVPLHDRVSIAWAHRLARTSREAFAVFPFGDTLTSRAVAEWTVVENSGSEPDPSALAWLRERLFTASKDGADADDSFQMFSAPGEGRECVEIARRALDAAREGVPFDEMVVVLRSPDRYRDHLVRSCERAGVPLQFNRGARAPDPSGRALLALLDCRAEQYSARAFAEYLSLGVVPRRAEPADAGEYAAPESPLFSYGDEPERAETPIEALIRWAKEDPIAAGGGLRVPRRWEALLVDAAVVGSKARWRRRLDGLDQKLRLELERVREPDGPRYASIERQREDLATLREFALPIIEELSALPERASWGQWCQSLTALSERTLSEPERVVQALVELAPMREVDAISLAEVRQALATRLREVTAPRRPDAIGVRVMSTDEVRGAGFRVAFVPGLAERMFPKRVPVDPLLSDARRIEIGLPARADRAEQERLALRLAVGAAKERVVCSWPRMDMDRGRARVPSFYALELERSLRGALPDTREFGQRAAASGGADLEWPAPADSANAIDEAEFDLAQLRDCLRDVSGAAGGMAHVLDAYPGVRRALGARARRWDNPRGWTRADGLLVDQGTPARALLDQHQLESRRFSATALQRFATCPYQFYLHQILRLEPRDVPQPLDELDALERGSLIHEIQFRVLLRARESQHLPLSVPANLAYATEQLGVVCSEVAAEWAEKIVPAIPRVWQDGVAQIEMDCRRWLERLAADSEWQPSHFELAFGMSHLGSRDPQSHDEPARLPGGLALRGSIDLVERGEAGLRASDYKTGRASATQGLVVDGGKVLQPVLYAMALEALFPNAEVQGGRLDYCTMRGGYDERVVALSEEARSAVQELLDIYTDFIAAGFLPALPRDETACKWCDYRPVCGAHEASRTSERKPLDKPRTVGRLRLFRERT